MRKQWRPFYMTRRGQWLLKLAHARWTPRWLHDALERVAYGPYPRFEQSGTVGNEERPE